MKITIQPTLERKQDITFLGIFEEDNSNYKSYDNSLAAELDNAIKKKLFSKKFGELYSTQVDGKRTIIVGLGKKEEFSVEKMRKALGKAVRCTRSLKLESLETNIAELGHDLHQFSYEMVGRAAAEGLFLANYAFTKYFSGERLEKEKNLTWTVLQWSGSPEKFNAGLSDGMIIADATNMVKDLVNEPASVVTPSYLEQAAKKLVSLKGVSVRIMEKDEMKKEGLQAILGVSKGSDLPPKLVFIEYKGAKQGKLIALIGKGITFDSGGYNLKPTHYIEDMKSDMAGAATVMATIKAAAELGIKKNLLAVMPLCENLVSGSAQKPGDIVKAYNGKTIEITNTDAEGRLILADALSYTEATYQPDIMIDLATLTGACVVALGYHAAGLISKDEELVKELTNAGLDSYDRVWRLPLFDEYQDSMDGTISDLQNTSRKGKGYDAGAITAGVFLSKFVDKAKWAHIDIAGPAYWVEDGDYLQKGGTGFGVRLLVYYLLQQ